MFEHPAGWRLITALVEWSGDVALVELQNRRARIVHFEVVVGEQVRKVRVGGNDSYALVVEVPDGEELSILSDDDRQRILFVGTPDKE